MANPAAQAEALKNSYVSSIVDEFGKGNLPKATGVEPLAQETASMHLFPNAGKTGGINDGDPGSYVHYDDGTTIKGPSRPSFANPLQGSPANSGERELRDMNPGTQQKMLRDDDIRRGYGTGDYAFGGPNLAGKLGMEQGQSAGVVLDLLNHGMIRKNDGNPRFVIRDGNRSVTHHDSAAAMPVTGQGFGAADGRALTPSQVNAGAQILYGGRNEVDLLPRSAASNADINRLYSSAMSGGYTPNYSGRPH